MTKRITLVCAGGMSTSLLVSKMKAAAAQLGIDAEIRAMAEGSFDAEAMKKTDVLLLGPQIAYKLKDLKARCEPAGVKIAVINAVDYGMMNGEKVVKAALEL